MSSAIKDAKESQAIIYYGFPLANYDGDEPDYFDINDQWHQSKRPAQPTDTDYRSSEWDAWREKANAWEKTAENVAITWSGGERNEAFYVHAEGLKVNVNWSEHKPLTGTFDPIPEADEQIRQFCERYGFEYRQPGWHLAARYF